jgi:hypothetical protein
VHPASPWCCLIQRPPGYFFSSAKTIGTSAISAPQDRHPLCSQRHDWHQHCPIKGPSGDFFTPARSRLLLPSPQRSCPPSNKNGKKINQQLFIDHRNPVLSHRVHASYSVGHLAKVERKSINNYFSITGIPSSITRMRAIVPASSFSVGQQEPIANAFAACDTRSQTLVGAIARASVLPRGQTRTRWSDPVGRSTAVLSNPRRRWRTMDGCACQDSGRCGRAANGHICAHNGRGGELPVSLLLWLLFAFAQIGRHVLIHNGRGGELPVCLLLG